MTNQISKCSVEKNRRRHFERAVGESRNLLSSRFLRFASLRDASVEMTVGVFYRAISKMIFCILQCNFDI